jgi:hypothetical protein
MPQLFKYLFTLRTAELFISVANNPSNVKVKDFRERKRRRMAIPENKKTRK